MLRTQVHLESNKLNASGSDSFRRAASHWPTPQMNLNLADHFDSKCFALQSPNFSIQQTLACRTLGDDTVTLKDCAEHVCVIWRHKSSEHWLDNHISVAHLRLTSTCERLRSIQLGETLNMTDDRMCNVPGWRCKCWQGEQGGSFCQQSSRRRVPGESHFLQTSACCMKLTVT